jgi:hypothetical protein
MLDYLHYGFLRQQSEQLNLFVPLMNENIKNANPFRTAFGLLTKTTPFLLLNLAIYGGFFITSVLWLVIFGSIAYFFSTRVELLAFLFFIIAVAGPYSVLIFGKRYILYLVKGAHIAVLTKLFVDGELPDNKQQVAYGREVVKDYFRDVSILFALDRMIDRIVRRFTRHFVRIVDFLPLGGGASKIARWAAMIVNRSLSYVDEAILSYAISKNEKNIWNSARHGIILYAQSYKPVLMTAVKVWVLGRVFFIGMLILLGIPGILLMLVFEAVWFQLITFVAVLLLSSLLVRAVFDPFATAYTLVTYHQSIEGVEVNKEWDDRLRSISKSFRDLVGKAKQYGGADSTEATYKTEKEKQI